MDVGVDSGQASGGRKKYEGELKGNDASFAAELLGFRGCQCLKKEWHNEVREKRTGAERSSSWFQPRVAWGFTVGPGLGAVDGGPPACCGIAAATLVTVLLVHGALEL